MEEIQKKNSSMPTVNERRIWKFYEWAVVLAPLLLMLSHWYIFYGFSQNTYELMHYSEENEPCIAWIYFVLYLYIPIMLLPATYFFRWCNLFRIPFIYLLCINVERWYYGDWFCTNEMVGTHYFLIYCTIAAYIVNVVTLIVKYKKDLPSYLSQASFYMARKCKSVFGKGNIRDARYDKIVNILEDSSHDETKGTISM